MAVAERAPEEGRGECQGTEIVGYRAEDPLTSQVHECGTNTQQSAEKIPGHQLSDLRC